MRQNKKRWDVLYNKSVAMISFCRVVVPRPSSIPRGMQWHDGYHMHSFNMEIIHTYLHPFSWKLFRCYYLPFTNHCLHHISLLNFKVCNLISTRLLRRLLWLFVATEEATQIKCINGNNFYIIIVICSLDGWGFGQIYRSLSAGNTNQEDINYIPQTEFNECG